MSDAHRFTLFCINTKLPFTSPFHDTGKVHFGELRIHDGVNYISVKSYTELDHKILFAYVSRYAFS